MKEEKKDGWITITMPFAERLIDEEVYKLMTDEQKKQANQDIIDSFNRILKIEADPRFEI